MKTKSNFSGKTIGIVGLGESGVAMARYLAKEGAILKVADTRAAPPEDHLMVIALIVLPENRQFGALTADFFVGLDLIALSPGVPLQDVQALAGALPIVSEIEIFAEAVRQKAPTSKILAITGSNGKTTTTALTAYLLNAVEVSATACGNISPSALDAFMAAEALGVFPDVWVLELSSFQLETTAHLNAKAATLLNVSEDHLDRYAGSMAAYADAKSRIFQGKPVMVLNRDDDASLSNARCGRTVQTFGRNPPPREKDYGVVEGKIYRGKTPILSLSDLKLVGLHHAANVMAAFLLCESLGVDPKNLVVAACDFAGLPHRVETVATVDGILCVDDSKGTNVGATLAAIEGMGRKVGLVLGGQGKGQNFTPLAGALKEHGRAVALIGEDALKIAAAIVDCGIPTAHCQSMAAAVDYLFDQCKAGDCLLLSPACASFDMFKNYEDRANVFIAAVHAQKGAKKREQRS